MIWQGGSIDDFLSHLMCCCCALVQELREVEIRGASYGIYIYTDRLALLNIDFEFLDLIFETGTEKTKKLTPPTHQFMEE